MYKNDVRFELYKLRNIEHNIIPVLCIFTFIELRHDSIVQQEEFKDVFNIMRGRTAENGNPFVWNPCLSATFQKRAPDRLSFLENIGIIEGECHS